MKTRRGGLETWLLDRGMLGGGALALAMLGGCDGSVTSDTDAARLDDVGPSVVGDGGTATGNDAYVTPGTDAYVTPGTDAGPAPMVDAATSCTGAGCTCFRATRLWFEDFETGNYARWTGADYGNAWGNACQNTATQGSVVHGGAGAQRSEVVCASTEDVHRGYGGLQFSGDTVLPQYTNTGMGLVAANGVVSTFWVRVEAPYAFADGRWLSLFTINPSCDYSTRVVTVGLDQADGILHPAHYWPEGSVAQAASAPVLSMGDWHRITIYVNFDDGTMHAWQDGASVFHVTGIVRPRHDYCQWHWGLYASGNNTDVVLYEDDKTVWRLDQAWTDFDREPFFGGTQTVCD